VSVMSLREGEGLTIFDVNIMSVLVWSSGEVRLNKKFFKERLKKRQIRSSEVELGHVFVGKFLTYQVNLTSTPEFDKVCRRNGGDDVRTAPGSR